MASNSSHTIGASDMREAGFTYDPTFNGYERWTHYPKEITCLRQPCMTDTQWEQEKRAAIEQASKSDEDVTR